MIKLGEKVKDRITDLTGIAVARCEFINGCIQYCVLPKSKDDKYPEGSYIDEARLEVIEEIIDIDKKATGGIMVEKPHSDNFI